MYIQRKNEDKCNTVVATSSAENDAAPCVCKMTDKFTLLTSLFNLDIIETHTCEIFCISMRLACFQREGTTSLSGFWHAAQYFASELPLGRRRRRKEKRKRGCSKLSSSLCHLLLIAWEPEQSLSIPDVDRVRAWYVQQCRPR